MKTSMIALCVMTLPVVGCASIEQLYRDQKRYEAMERGSETYRLGGKDKTDPQVSSLDEGLRAANAEMANYRTYRAITKGVDIPFNNIDGEIETLLNKLDTLELRLGEMKVDKQKADCKLAIDAQREALRTLRRKKAEAIHTQDIKALQEIGSNLDRARVEYSRLEKRVKYSGSSEVTTEAYQGDDYSQKSSALPGNPGKANSEIGVIWPESLLNQVSPPCKKGEACENKPVSEELIRALSSTASIAQMRDLLTEPSFPMMLPVERTVNLGCLPPPDSAAFEAVHKLKAGLQDKQFNADGSLKTDRSATLETEFSSSVVKLFEESERTLFLQYALFRLCEMSVNAPAGFRNVYPVIIHDIVRRTAEMNQVALKEAEERKKAEADVARTKAELEIEKLKTEQVQLQRDEITKNRRRVCVDEKVKANTAKSADKYEKIDDYIKQCATEG